MKGRARYAGGVRLVAMAAAVVVALLVLGVALDRTLLGGTGSAREPVAASSSPAAATTPVATPRPAPPAAPRIVVDHLTFGAARKAATAAYEQRHYGTRTARLVPTLIVLHYSESDTYASVRSLFETDQPNRGEQPGTCAHYVVDQDGTISELVPPTVMCRHTVGLNHLAIGIEFVQSSRGHEPRWAARQVLGRAAQAAAGVALVEALQRRFAISDDEVIGHAMANQANGFRDDEGWRNDHLDWQAPEVVAFRRMLTTDP